MDKLGRRELVKPYPIPELNGELGLSAHDVARSLGVNPKNVLEKLRRGDWYVSDRWVVAAYTAANDSNGLDKTGYYLNLRAAKAFVARWKNKLGDAYLDYLFDCEEQVEKQLPLLKQLIEKLTAPRRKTTPKGVFVEREKVTVTRTIFGEEEVLVEKERIPIELATAAEIEAYRVKHRQRVVKGITDAQNKALNPEDYKALPPSKTKLEVISGRNT